MGGVRKLARLNLAGRWESDGKVVFFPAGSFLRRSVSHSQSIDDCGKKQAANHSESVRDHERWVRSGRAAKFLLLRFNTSQSSGCKEALFMWPVQGLLHSH